MLWVIAGICSVLKERNRGGSHNASCLYPIHLSLHPHPHTTVKWYPISRIQTFTETSLICDWATRTRSELTPTNQVGRWHNVACALAVSMATLTASSLNQQKVTIVRKLFSTDQWMCICNIYRNRCYFSDYHIFIQPLWPYFNSMCSIFWCTIQSI